MPPELLGDTEVTHPMFWKIPLLSRPFNGTLYAHAILPILRRTTFEGVLVNWAYPDAYGVMLAARALRFPFATTVQGSDVNLFMRTPWQRRLILKALRASSVVFTRSKALSAVLAKHGIQSIPVYNGIDRSRFRPRSRAQSRQRLGLDPGRRTVLFVGTLKPVKGPLFLSDAFLRLRDLHDLDLVLIGSGPERAKISQGPRVRVLGSRHHAEVAMWMNACDVVAVPSLNEGLPNVVIEALASGTPVVASDVGGVSELIVDGKNGLLVPARDVQALEAALRRALEMTWEQPELVASVSRFDWATSAAVVWRTFSDSMRRS